MRVSFRQYSRLLATYLLPQRRRTAMLALFLTLSITFQLLSPQVMARFIDRALAGAPLNDLFLLAGFFLVLAVLTQVINIGEVWTAEGVGWTATNNLRGDLAMHVLGLDSAFHNRHTPGALIERVDGDVEKLGNFFARFVIQILGNGLLAVGIFALLFRIDWRIGLALVAFAIVAVFLINALRDVAVPHFAADREASAQVYGFIEERLAGTEDIRSAGATSYVMRANHVLARTFLRTRLRANIYGSASWSSSILMFAIGTAISLGVGAWLYRDGTITIGTVYLIFQYASVLNQPIEQITRQMQDLQQAGASVVRIQDILDEEPTLHDGPGADLPATATGREIVFDRVTFGYGVDQPVLRDVSFRIAPGAVLGVVGRTGSGKTTLTRLLLRLHDPDAGSIQLDGVDLRQFGLHELRGQIGVVTQDIQLFAASVRDNLTLFDRTIDDALILATLGDLGLEPWLRALGDGLDTVLASGGGGLSAGEAQLIAFARVFLHDPRVVILDEASSRLDPATEIRLEHAIDRLFAGRTAIVIAHRLATVNRADQILVLEQGSVVEHGDRATLVADPASRFAQMLRTGQDVLAGERV